MILTNEFLDSVEQKTARKSHNLGITTKQDIWDHWFGRWHILWIRRLDPGDIWWRLNKCIEDERIQATVCVATENARPTMHDRALILLKILALYKSYTYLLKSW